MKKIFTFTLSILVLAGCVTFGQLEEGLNLLGGRSESEVFNALGYPDGKQEIGEETMYIWSTNRTMLLPNTQTTTGYVGGTPFYGTSTTTSTLNLNCTIKIIFSSGMVKTWQYQGNLGGCEPYINRLNNYFKQ